MKTTMYVVAAIYVLLIFNFYHRSNGFTKFHDEFYAYWKMIPLVFLVAFTFLHQIGMNVRDSQIAAMGLAFGAIGDYLIGASHDGIVAGAIVFGLGHLSYLSLFAHKTKSVYIPLAIAVLSWGATLGHFCLLPMLSQHPIAVGIMTIYSLILSSCVILAASQYIYRSEKDSEDALFYRLLGFGLFLVSDSSLILHHTDHYVPLEELLILGTYFSSQYFILHSFVSQAIHDNVKKVK